MTPSKKSAAKASGPRKPRKSTKKRAGGGSFGRWLAAEALVWTAGFALGGGIVAFTLYGRAKHDVEQYLVDPPTARPSIVYSAPMEVRAGVQADADAFTADLLAAGYEKVASVQRPGQFAIDGRRFDVWTGALDGSGFEVEEQRASIVFGEDGTIADVEPGDLVILRPTVLATIGDPEERRSDLALADVSPWVEKAVTSVEDSRFRFHHGVDPVGVGRAIVHDLSGRDLHGGSTLTQQLAKNLFLTPERTMQRKIREAFFAVAIENRLSKDEILELYLREVYLGQAGGVPVYGVDGAARAWFGVSAKSLSIGEAATIAGVISSPNAYSPLKHPEVARKRRDLAIDRMVAVGALDAETATAEKAKDLVVDGQFPGAVRRAPWAVDEAVAYAEHALGDGVLATGGFSVYTTIQPLAQRAAEKALRDGMAEVEAKFPKAAGAEAALVSVRKDGSVIAMVGGRNYIKSPFDRATDAWREVGSTAKPLVLLAAFDADSDLTPLTRLWDSPISRRVDGKNWNPANYDSTFHGEVTLRKAMEASYNIPAIRLSETLGLEKTQAFLREAGLENATNWPSVALGAFAATPWQMAGAFTAFPGGGTMHSAWLVRSIADPNGADAVIFEPEATELASARATALAVSVLQGVITDGTGARARDYGVSGPVGAKTGTTNDYRDAWMIGFTPDLVTAVWVGRDRDGNLGLSGSRAALPPWAMYMAAMGPVRGKFRVPDGVVTASVCGDSEMPARDACPVRYTELFPVGAVPGKACDLHGGGVLASLAGLLAAPAEAPEPGDVVPVRDPGDDKREQRQAEREQRRQEQP